MPLTIAAVGHANLRGVDWSADGVERGSGSLGNFDKGHFDSFFALRRVEAADQSQLRAQSHTNILGQDCFNSFAFAFRLIDGNRDDATMFFCIS